MRRRRARTVRRRGLRIRSLPFTGFGMSKIVRLRYVDYLVLNPPAAGVALFHHYRANSVNDPDLTGSGHQPRGYDFWNNLYAQYVVISSKIRVILTEATNGNQIPGYYGIWNLRGTADVDNLDNLAQMMESKLPHSRLARAGILGGGRQGQGMAGIGMTYSSRRFNGRRPLGNDDEIAAVSGNPVSTATFSVGCAGATLTTDPGTFNFMVTIDYVVKFMRPLTLSQS